MITGLFLFIRYLTGVFVQKNYPQRIVMVRSGSDITIDEYYCQIHKKWNWCGDECHCCAPEEEE